VSGTVFLVLGWAFALLAVAAAVLAVVLAVRGDEFDAMDRERVVVRAALRRSPIDGRAWK